MTWASVVTALGLWLGGLGILRALGPRRHRPALELHATAVLLGVVLVSALHVALVVALGPLSPLQGRLLLGLFALGGVAALVRGFPAAAAPVPAADEEPAGALVKTGLALVLLFAAFAVFNAGSMPMHVFDPVYHFAYKGKLIFHEGFDTPAWKDLNGSVGRIITHPEYPPGVPALEAVLACVNGSFDEDAARALMALYVLVPAAWLWCALRGRSRAAATAAALLWVSLPFLYYTRLPNKFPDSALRELGYGVYGLLFGPEAGALKFRDSGVWSLPDGWTIDGAGDLPLAAVYFGAFLYLTRLLPGSGLARDRADAGTAAILLGGAMLAKNEGLALAGVLATGFVLTLLVRRLAGAANRDDAEHAAPRPLPALLVSLVVGAALYAPWVWAKRHIPVIDEDYPSLLSPAGIWSRLDRAGEVWSGFRDSFTWFLRWDLLWPLFFATLAWALLRPVRFLRHPALPAVLVVLGAFALYFLILLVTPWDLEVLFPTVIPGRLILHVTPIAILALVSLLWRTRAEAGLAEAPLEDDPA